MSKRYPPNREERKDIIDRRNRKLNTEMYLHNVFRNLQTVGWGGGAWEGGEGIRRRSVRQWGPEKETDKTRKGSATP